MGKVKVNFKEEQHMDMWWFRLILIASLFLAILSIYITWGGELYDNLGAVIFFWVVIASSSVILIALLFWKLKTKINSVGIEMIAWPIKKKVLWNEISELEVIDYGFVGGWGMRVGTKYGTVYNTSGSKGLRIKLKTGKKFLIGTQKEEELKKLVKKWKNISS